MRKQAVAARLISSTRILFIDLGMKRRSVHESGESLVNDLKD